MAARGRGPSFHDTRAVVAGRHALRSRQRGRLLWVRVIGAHVAHVSRYAFVLGVSGVAAIAPSASAAGPCDAPANPIVAENCLPGNPPSQWDVSGAGDPSIQGFATQISVNRVTRCTSR